MYLHSALNTHAMPIAGCHTASIQDMRHNTACLSLVHKEQHIDIMLKSTD